MNKNTSPQGQIHLIPVGIGSEQTNLWLPAQVQEIAANLKTYIAENAKTARAFLKQVNTIHDLRDITIHTISKKTDNAEISKWLEPINQGHDIGLVSEAGCPAVADPGAMVVAYAHKTNIEIIPHVGPSSILLGLMASGLDGQRFAFHGYAPIDGEKRKQQLVQWEKTSATQHQTQIIIETPYRNETMFDALLKNLKPNTRLCVAKAISAPEQVICTKTISQWRKSPKPNLQKSPTVFLFLA